MKVLIACEYSGRVRRAFAEKGHAARSCDFLPAEDDSPDHYQGDVRDLLTEQWDLLIAHPPCTYLASSGLHWNKRVPGRAEQTEEALAFVKFLLDQPIQKIALENPIGCISTRIRKPEQVIQPWWFGDDASKSTCLWLKGLAPLEVNWARAVFPKSACCGYPVNTQFYKGQRICPQCGKPTKFINANQTASGQNKLAPSPDRWKERSRTYQGIANAMAEQWGK